MRAKLSLIFETSTPQASLALAGPDGVIEHREFRSDRNHNAVLFEPLQDLLEDEGRTAGIDLVITGTGPGSYSGTRVGIAAAQGVGIALGCAVVGVPSVLAVPSAENGAACLAIGDARRGSFWSVRVEGFRLAGEMHLGDAGELETRVSAALERGQPVFSFEDPARLPLSGALAAAVRHEFPDAARLWRAWSGTDEDRRKMWAAEIPQPIYLKPPHITPAKRPWLVKPV